MLTFYATISQEGNEGESKAYQYKNLHAKKTKLTVAASNCDPTVNEQVLRKQMEPALQRSVRKDCTVPTSRFVTIGFNC